MTSPVAVSCVVVLSLANNGVVVDDELSMT
jgi:hypothetical protein